MPTDDRDRQFERALGRHLPGGFAESDCPDAEILAAYHERTLPLGEMASWKEHIASCQRCQETLAIVEQTEPVAAEEWKEQDGIVAAKPATAAAHMLQAAAREAQEEAGLPVATGAPLEMPIRRPRTPWKWIVPVGAVAAGVIVWIGATEIRKQQRQPSEAVQIALNRQTATPPPGPRREAPPRDVPEQKQAELSDKARGDETSVGAPVAHEVVPPQGGRASPSREGYTYQVPAAKAVPPSKEELDKKKDAAGGFGSGVGARVPAPMPPPTDSLAKSRNEGMPAANQNLGMIASAAGGGVPPVAPERAEAARTAPAANRPKAAMAEKTQGLSAISGVVLDPSGAAIGGSVITAVDASTGNSRTTVADAAGKFLLGDLPTDQYRVVVAHAGFAPSEQTLQLPPRTREALEFRLRMEAVTESVEVTGAATALNAETAEVSAAKDQNSINGLPISGRSYTALQQLGLSNPRYIVAPDQKLTWRVGEAGKIERSADRGKSWKAQTSGVSADLTAGSATSAKVCWVIGKAGTILATTDGGKHWKRLASPFADDIGGIHARDAQHASIWDAANRRSFETTDGGATWKPIAHE